LFPYSENIVVPCKGTHNMFFISILPKMIATK
jgi:hypothetical protein